MKKRVLAVFIMITAAAMGCAPGLGTSLRLDGVSLPQELATQSAVRRGAAIRLADVVDSRADQAVADISGRGVPFEGNLADFLRIQLERQLIANQARIVLFDAPTLETTILEWQVRVDTGFPTTSLESRARVDVRLADADGRTLYGATYSGSVSKQHPAPTESTIKDVLSESMGYAFSELVSDERLWSKLGANR